MSATRPRATRGGSRAGSACERGGTRSGAVSCPSRLSQDISAGVLTESVYRRYAIVSQADLREGVRKLAAYRQAVAARQPTVVPLAQAP